MPRYYAPKTRLVQTPQTPNVPRILKTAAAEKRGGGGGGGDKELFSGSTEAQLFMLSPGVVPRSGLASYSAGLAQVRT